MISNEKVMNFIVSTTNGSVAFILTNSYLEWPPIVCAIIGAAWASWFAID